MPHLSLLAAELGDGNEIIMPASTYPPVADCFRLVGARPVLVEVDERTGCLDLSLLEPLITPRARAVIPPHMYEHPTDMDPLVELAHDHNLIVIEDAVRALGSHYRGRMTGSV